MKPEDLSLLRDRGLTREEIEKLNIVLAFYERLPTDELKQALLALMENQPFMVPSEFDLRLDDFAARVKTAAAYAQVSAYLASAALPRMH